MKPRRNFNQSTVKMINNPLHLLDLIPTIIVQEIQQLNYNAPKHPADQFTIITLGHTVSLCIFVVAAFLKLHKSLPLNPKRQTQRSHCEHRFWRDLDYDEAVTIRMNFLIGDLVLLSVKIW
jgi:hypothetical protein